MDNKPSNNEPMKNKNVAKLIVLKIICCGVIIFFLLGGIGLLAGLGTGNSLLVALGVTILLWATYKTSMILLNVFRKQD